jgi:hypothetical protein
VASIQLNGAPVALTANAHRHHTFNVTHLLVPGANVLNITLLPAPRYAAEQGAAYPYEVPATQVDQCSVIAGIVCSNAAQWMRSLQRRWHAVFAAGLID